MADLERQDVVDVLQDRSAKTTAAWLANHPRSKSSVETAAASMPRRPSKAGPRVWLDRFDQVKALQDAGRNLNAIIEQTGLNWRTVAKWLEADALPGRPPRDP